MSEGVILDGKTCARLAGLIRREVELCQDVLELGRETAALGIKESTEDRLVGRGRRELLMEELGRVEEELAPLRESWEESEELPVQAGEIAELSNRMKWLIEAMGRMGIVWPGARGAEGNGAGVSVVRGRLRVEEIRVAERAQTGESL